MNTPSKADIEAARIVLGASVARTHERVRGLPGEAECSHSLSGTGRPVKREDKNYWLTPYRHHDFTAVREGQYCQCGNSLTHIVHNRCQ